MANEQRGNGHQGGVLQTKGSAYTADTPNHRYPGNLDTPEPPNHRYNPEYHRISTIKLNLSINCTNFIKICHFSKSCKFTQIASKFEPWLISTPVTKFISKKYRIIKFFPFLIQVPFIPFATWRFSTLHPFRFRCLVFGCNHPSISVRSAAT